MKVELKKEEIILICRLLPKDTKESRKIVRRLETKIKSKNQSWYDFCLEFYGDICI